MSYFMSAGSQVLGPSSSYLLHILAGKARRCVSRTWTSAYVGCQCHSGLTLCAAVLAPVVLMVMIKTLIFVYVVEVSMVSATHLS